MNRPAKESRSDGAASTGSATVRSVCVIILLAVCCACLAMNVLAQHSLRSPAKAEQLDLKTAPKPLDPSPKADEPPSAPTPGEPGFLFQSTTPLSVRLDFFRPNSGNVPDEKYFAVDKTENERRFPWNEILLVNATPGLDNASKHTLQIRARVRGLKALIEKSDPAADTFPVRIYRTFVNDLDDDESVYGNAFTKLFGAAPTEEGGLVKEPAGRRIELKRIKAIAGEDAIFISDVIDIATDKDLNPVMSTLPAAPAFAASDGDAYYTQYHQTIGDEEPDAWAFGQAMKGLGFVSAGVAHPVAKTFTGRGKPYQFALSLRELLNLHGNDDSEEQCDPQDIEMLQKLSAQARVGTLKEHFKNLGGSKLIGRPVMNGAFVISTGVQKIVVTAMGAYRPGDVTWRFPGIVHLTEGYMDQCLVRAPAQIFLFSGHGWNVSEGGRAYALFNCYSKDNFAAFNDPSFCPYFASYLPGNHWPGYLRAAEENKVVLADKWKKNELRLQWLFLVGCEVLNPGSDPFEKYRSNCGTFGTLMFKELDLIGVLGFSAHGFTSATLIKRFADRAATVGIAHEWMDIFHDEESRAYTWYETNESYGRSHQKNFSDFQKIIPAYLIRKEHLKDKLVPDALATPVGSAEVQFNDVDNASASGRFGD